MAGPYTSFSVSVEFRVVDGERVFLPLPAVPRGCPASRGPG